jgi:putative effector of murein hydrolase
MNLCISHPLLSVGAPSAHVTVAAVAEPFWTTALVETLTKFTGSSPARSAKACTAVEVSTAIRWFNEATQLMITFSDVAGPVACKAILDQLAQGTIGFESRCAPCNVKPWAGVDGTSIKEKTGQVPAH